MQGLKNFPSTTTPCKKRVDGFREEGGTN